MKFLLTKLFLSLLLIAFSFHALADVPVDSKWVKRKTFEARFRVPAAGWAVGDVITSNVRIPQGAVIVNAFGVVKTALVQSGPSNSHMSVGCENSPDLIAAATQAGAAGTLLTGVPVGTQATYNYVSTTGGCRVSGYIKHPVGSTADTGFTSGEIIVPVEYYEIR